MSIDHDQAAMTLSTHNHVSLPEHAVLQDVLDDLIRSLAAIQQISELDSKVNDEKTLISRALHILLQNQDMERCSFFLWVEDRLVNVTGMSVDELAGLRQTPLPPSRTFRLGEGIIGMAAQTRAMQYCENCPEDTRFATQGAANDPIPGSLISVPVLAGEELLGVLNVSHPQPRYFTEWHKRLLHIYRNLLGQLITNARLFQKMEQQINARTAKLRKALDEVQLLKERYEQLSMIDELTGLYNRRYFYAQLETAVARSKRYGEPLCLLVMDLDHFKAVNDRFGHLNGDQVLVNVGACLKRQVRESDVVVRYGGEEFIVILTNTSYANGKLFAERVCNAIAELHWTFDDQTLRMTMSIGLSCFDPHCTQLATMDFQQLIHRADLALYEAKARGRNRVLSYADLAGLASSSALS